MCVCVYVCVWVSACGSIYCYHVRVKDSVPFHSSAGILHRERILKHRAYLLPSVEPLSLVLEMLSDAKKLIKGAVGVRRGPNRLFPVLY